MATAPQIQTLPVLPSGVDHCSHWLDRASTPRQEARNLFALVGRSGVTVESIRELITVPPDIERTLQLYLRRHPEDAPGIEKVLSFRARVREEFDRLVCEGDESHRPVIDENEMHQQISADKRD